MSEIDETISEAVERADKSRLNSIVALLVAISATFMALCNVKRPHIRLFAGHKTNTQIS